MSKSENFEWVCFQWRQLQFQGLKYGLEGGIKVASHFAMKEETLRGF